jgi:arginase family enzyme
MHRWREAPVEAFGGPLYVSIDLDGIDPAFAPGVAHPEPGGLSTRDVVELLHRIRVPIAGIDVVEYNPGNDHRDLTARVAAKLLKEAVAVAVRNAAN